MERLVKARPLFTACIGYGAHIGWTFSGFRCTGTKAVFFALLWTAFIEDRTCREIASARTTVTVIAAVAVGILTTTRPWTATATTFAATIARTKLAIATGIVAGFVQHFLWTCAAQHADHIAMRIGWRAQRVGGFANGFHKDGFAIFVILNFSWLRGRRTRCLHQIGWVHLSDGLFDQALNLAQIVPLMRCTEGDRDPFSTGTRRPANPVDIGFRYVWQVKVEHMGHAINIDAACSHIGTYQQTGVAFAEALQRMLTRILALIAMDGINRHALLF